MTPPAMYECSNYSTYCNFDYWLLTFKGSLSGPLQECSLCLSLSKLASLTLMEEAKGKWGEGVFEDQVSILPFFALPSDNGPASFNKVSHYFQQGAKGNKSEDWNSKWKMGLRF